MQRSYTGATACCCKKEDCHVIERLDGYKNFYKSFEEEGVVWQPIKETQTVWNPQINRYEQKEILTDCKATVEDECTITLIDKKTKYKEDNIGIHFIEIPALRPALRHLVETTYSDKDESARVEHKITYAGHKLCFILERSSTYIEESEKYEVKTENYVTLDDKLIYEQSECFQDKSGLAFSEVAIIRKDSKSYLYAGSVLLEVISGGAESIFLYDCSITINNIDPIEIRYQDFEVWKPDKWWLFPERIIPYYTPSEIKKFSEKKAQQIKRIKCYGNKEKQGCPYPLRHERMDIDPRLYCENLSFKITGLPKFNLIYDSQVTVNLQPLTFERHVLTWEELPAYTVQSFGIEEHNPFSSVDSKNTGGYHTQAFSPTKVAEVPKNVIYIDELPYWFSPTYATTKLTWFPEDAIIFAPNICITLGQGERVIFDDIIHPLPETDIDDTKYWSHYFFKSINIIKQPKKGEVTIKETTYKTSLVYDAPEDATECIDIEYELVSVFGLKSKGVISIYIIDKDDPYYTAPRVYASGSLDPYLNAYVLDFWSYLGDTSLQTYHDDIILNKVSLNISSKGGNPEYSILEWSNPCHHGPNYTPNKWPLLAESHGFNITVDLYAGVHSRVMKLDNIKNLKYIYVPGASYGAVQNNLGHLCRTRNIILEKIEGSIYSIDDIFDAYYDVTQAEDVRYAVGVTEEEINRLNYLKEKTAQWYNSEHDPDATEEQARELVRSVNKNSFLIGDAHRFSSNTGDCFYFYNYNEVEFNTNILSNIYVKSSSAASNHTVGKFKHDIQNPYEPSSNKDLSELTLTFKEQFSILVWSNDAVPGETSACNSSIIANNVFRQGEYTIVIVNESEVYSRNGLNVPRLFTQLYYPELPLYRHCKNIARGCPDLFSEELIESSDNPELLIDANKEHWISLEETVETENPEDSEVCMGDEAGTPVGSLALSIGLDTIDIGDDSVNLLYGPAYGTSGQCKTQPGVEFCDIEQQLTTYSLINTNVEYYD